MRITNNLSHGFLFRNSHEWLTGQQPNPSPPNLDQKPCQTLIIKIMHHCRRLNTQYPSKTNKERFKYAMLKERRGRIYATYNELTCILMIRPVLCHPRTGAI